MRKHDSVLGGVALVLALTVTACSDDDVDPDPDDTPTVTATEAPTSSTAPTPMTDEQKAIAALESYLVFRDDAYRSGELVNTKKLKLLATGEEFVRLQNAVIDLKKYEIEVTGQYDHSLDKPRRRGDSTFLVTDCEDRGDVEEHKNGKPVPPATDPEGNPLGDPLPVTYEVVRQKSRWLVGNSDIKWEETC